MSSFVIKHWCGEYSVRRSLLVNTLLPDALLLTLQNRFVPMHDLVEPTAGRAMLLVTVLLWVLLLLWQFVGCFKSASSRVGYSGSALDLYIVFFGFLITAVPVLGGVFSMGDQFNRAQQSSALIDKPVEKKYALTLLESDVLLFSGEIDFGATRDLDSMLGKHPNITQVQLGSEGGIIVEARGMANTILREQLNTHVSTVCYSACTLVYISGTTRTLSSHAKLGFHQYRVDSVINYPWIDPATEHKKDQKRFASQKVADAFLEKMYDYDHASLWVPSHAELAQAGVKTVVN